MEKFKDYSNQKFGRLQPLKRLYVKNHKTYWLCKCDCGNIIEKPISYLISGNCKSYGKMILLIFTIGLWLMGIKTI